MGGRAAGRANAAGGHAAGRPNAAARLWGAGQRRGRAVDVLTCSQGAAYIYMQPNGCM